MRKNWIDQSDNEGILSYSKENIYEINYCLDYKTFETVCPVGIKYIDCWNSKNGNIWR